MKLKKIIKPILAIIILICYTTPVLYWIINDNLTIIQILSNIWPILLIGLIISTLYHIYTN